MLGSRLLVCTLICPCHQDDLALNEQRQPATRKLVMLPEVMDKLRQTRYYENFLEIGILPVLAQWLRPLNDGSLPALNIRTEISKIILAVSTSGPCY